MIGPREAIALALAISACAEQPTLSSTAGMSFEELEARTYREPDTGIYILDGDTTLLDVDELRAVWERLQSGALIVFTIGGQDVRWSDSAKRQITYCVNNNFGPNKSRVIAAMKAASDDGWERLGDVDFSYVPAQDASCTATNPNIVFNVIQESGDFLARAFRPSYERSKRSVKINPEMFQPGGRQPLDAVVTHELGHALGFMHEHIRPESGNTNPDCLDDDTYRALTEYDSASIMHYTPSCNGTASVLAFTEKDRIGVAALYGPPRTNAAPIAEVLAPADGATVSPSFDVQASIVDEDLAEATLSIDGTLYATTTAAPFTFTVRDLALGLHTLVVTATDRVGQATTRTLSVTVAGEQQDEDGMDDRDDAPTGGCAATGDATPLVLLAFVGLAYVRRRRPDRG